MIRRENISGWGILSQAILRSLAIRVVVSIFESHHGSEENPSDPIELFRSLLHQRTAIRRLWDQVRLVHLGRVWKARFRAVFEARRVSRNSPCAKQRANVHVVALTSSPFLLKNRSIVESARPRAKSWPPSADLRPVETTTYRKKNRSPAGC